MTEEKKLGKIEGVGKRKEGDFRFCKISYIYMTNSTEKVIKPFLAKIFKASKMSKNLKMYFILFILFSKDI